MKIVLYTTILLITFFSPKLHAETEAEKQMYIKVLEGTFLIFNGNPQVGKIKYLEALKSYPKKQIYTLLLLSMDTWGYHSSAVRFCETIPFAKAKTEPSIYYWCGRIFLKQKRTNDAYTYFKTALALGGDTPLYLTSAVISSVKKGKTGEAATLFSKLILKSPWLLSSALYPDEKTGIILTVEDLFSSYKYKGKLFHAIAFLMLKNNLPGLAFDYMQKAWSILKQKNDNQYVLMSNILKALGKNKESIQILKKGLSLYPDSTILNLEYAKYLIKQNKYIAARTRLLKILVYNPSNLEILLNLTLASVKTGNLTDAGKYLKYAELQNANGAEYFYIKGLYLQKKGKLYKALEMFSQAANFRPDKITYISALQVALDTAGKTKDSLKLLRHYNNLKNFKKRISRKHRLKLNEFFSLWNDYLNFIKTGSISNIKCGFQCKIFKVYSAIKKSRKSPLLKQLMYKFVKADLLNSPMLPNTIKETLTSEGININIYFHLPFIPEEKFR